MGGRLGRERYRDGRRVRNEKKTLTEAYIYFESSIRPGWAFLSLVGLRFLTEMGFRKTTASENRSINRGGHLNIDRFC